MFIKCPGEILDSRGYTTVFLGGGITGCPDWQATVPELVRYDSRADGIIWLNPRREDFDVTDESMSVAQIDWERKYLKSVDATLFWFPEETLCPITLFELGKQLGQSKSEVFVGCHPNYARRFDIVEQLRIDYPWIEVADSVDNLIEQVLEWEQEIRRF